MSKVSQFLQEAKSELFRVNWPTKNQVIQYTLLVIGISLVVAVFLGSLDYVFSFGLKEYILK